MAAKKKPRVLISWFIRVDRELSYGPSSVSRKVLDGFSCVGLLSAGGLFLYCQCLRETHLWRFCWGSTIISSRMRSRATYGV